jgi:hypothetical protein
MITIDSIKLQGTNDVIKDIDKTQFSRSQKFDKYDVLTSDISTIAGKDIKVCGLNQITFNNSDESLILQFSAKILSENYYDLINVNTIEQAIDRINETGIVIIDKQYLNNFKVLSCDFTNNIKGDHTPHEFIEACQLMSLNSNYKVDTYKAKNIKNGIVFRGKQVSFKERCIMYHKLDELKKDENFIKSLRLPMQMINQFDGVLRSEMNISSFAKIREYSNTANTLMSVLNSNAVNPNYKLFQKIKSKSGVQTDLFSMSQNMKLYEIEKLYGRQTIIKELCFDMDLIRDFIKKHVKGDTHKYIKDYRFIANEMLVTDNINGQNENSIIFELEQLLKVA